MHLINNNYYTWEDDFLPVKCLKVFLFYLFSYLFANNSMCKAISSFLTTIYAMMAFNEFLCNSVDRLLYSFVFINYYSNN